MNQRGGISDIFTVVLIFFIMAVGAVAGVLMMSELGDAGSLAPVSGLIGTAESAFVMFGAGAIIFLVGAALVITALAWKIKAHPAVVFIGLFFLFPLFIIGAGLSSVWTDFAGSGEMGAAAAQITGLNLVLNNFPMIILFLAGLVILGTYGGYYFVGRR